MNRGSVLIGISYSRSMGSMAMVILAHENRPLTLPSPQRGEGFKKSISSISTSLSPIGGEGRSSS